jgi:Fe-S-cluster-containing dehydrogenase component/formate-dependent nitrite reductase membrane component NrfD
MNYGFVIDNRKCIGCHACSTACKSENEVPLGVYRTWVKYTEVGSYPDVSRRFQVTRCNHCDNPPCVRICPVTAMYQRHDGIVDFDNDQCIACKACMQACPYDSIHIDPDTNTAAKCNFCAHRTELNLEPSCVVVCPTHAIVAGDLENPDHEISKILGKEKVSVRKPEQGTAPKLFYIDGDEVSLNPTAANVTPESYLWADVVGESKFSGIPDAHTPSETGTSHKGEKLRLPQHQGLPSAGNVPSKPVWNSAGGQKTQSADQMVQVAYNAQHKVPWHWPVPAYLVTKGIAGGVMLLLSFLYMMNDIFFSHTTALWATSVALFFVLVTTALLIYDLERPERFLRIILRPQWKSWLTRGSFILIGFSKLLGLWWAMEVGYALGYIPADIMLMTRPWLVYLMLPLSLGAIVYTAFLFAQAEGRDLWQSSSLPFHLFVQGLMCGSGLLVFLTPFGVVNGLVILVAQKVFMITVIVDLIFQCVEFGMPHSSEVAARAAHEITHGEYKTKFWFGNIFLGHIAVIALLMYGGASIAAFASVICMIGLYFYEYAFVMAPQRVPNS